MKKNNIDKSLDPLQELKKFEELVVACNRCGFCTSYCPTYNATGKEVHSPRGRNQAVRAIIQGNLSNPQHISEAIDTCLLCGECTTICFSEVPTAQLMMSARNYLNQSLGLSRPLKFIFFFLLPYPRRLKILLKLGMLFKKCGLVWFLKKTGLLKRISPTLAAANELVPTAPFKFLLDYNFTRPFQEKVVDDRAQHQALVYQKIVQKGGALPSPMQPPRPKVALMPVCGSQYMRPSIGLATIGLFKIMKVDFLIPEVVCCGLPAATYGVDEGVRTLAKQNVTLLEKGHFEFIVTDDSSCTTHLKSYTRFFQDDAKWLKRSHDLSQKIRELSQFLIQRGLKEHLKLSPWSGSLVAYHDPCKAQYGQKLTNPPRELLAAIPRLQVVPISDADQCCGGGGTYSFAHPAMSQGVLEAKTKNILASGCKIVVTSSASCLIQLAFGLRKKGSNIEVLHLTEFLLRALEKRR